MAEQTVAAQLTAGRKEVEVTDGQGRVIKLAKPNPLANLDFAKAAGGGQVNMLYLSEVAHLKYVVAIDGAVVPTPSTEAELRALYARLGDDGNEAAQRGLVEHFMPKDDGDEGLKNF